VQAGGCLVLDYLTNPASANTPANRLLQVFRRWLVFYISRKSIMSKTQTINKYAHLEYEVLHKLDISIPEYWLLDMVYQLSRDGWCWKSLNSIANDMRMSKNGVIKMRDRLIEKGYLKKNIKGHLKTGVAYHSVYHLDKATYHSVQNRTTKFTDTVPLSSTKNNNEINIDNRGEYSANKEKLRQMLKQKGLIRG